MHTDDIHPPPSPDFLLNHNVQSMLSLFARFQDNFTIDPIDDDDAHLIPPTPDPECLPTMANLVDLYPHIGRMSVCVPSLSMFFSFSFFTVRSHSPSYLSTQGALPSSATIFRPISATTTTGFSAVLGCKTYMATWPLPPMYVCSVIFFTYHQQLMLCLLSRRSIPPSLSAQYLSTHALSTRSSTVSTSTSTPPIAG